jgi:thiol-disulfide isomerase/thioredoxin
MNLHKLSLGLGLFLNLCNWMPAMAVLPFDSTKLYHADIQLNDRLSLPFVLAYIEGPTPSLVILNGKEEIAMTLQKEVQDTLYFDFPQVAGSLVFSKITQRGYWLNLNKAKATQFPFNFYKSSKSNLRFDSDAHSFSEDFSGRYAVQFTDKDNHVESAIGLFQQNGNQVEGTFRTETGDYRYLEGMVQGNKLRMSSFDGVHAYYFEGILTDNKRIQGDFYSGSTYHVTWEGTKDDAIELRSPYQISHAIEPNETLRISVKKQNGRKKTLSATYFRGQPTVVQIIGTWCPNCLDETNYFKSLLEKPEFSNIRWVSIAFENGETDAERIKRIQAYVRKSKLKHAFYLGGGASSKAASTVFHQLNGVFSFPTTLYLDKNGRIASIHSGFDGPATQNYFEDYKKNTETLLRSLMARPE